MDDLDIEQPSQLLAYLRQSGRVGADETPTMRTLAGGVSNRTVLVLRPGGEAWVLKQALAKLRVKTEWFSSPLRIHREALGLRWLDKLIPGASPALLFEDPSHHILAMQAVPQPHENWKEMLLAGRVESAHARQFGAMLGAIHCAARAHRPQIEADFAERSFFESLRLEPYYAYAAQQVPQARPFLDALIAETRAMRVTLVHGDYSPKNVLVHAGRLVLLDHEVVHWGDPAFDAGFALTHLLSKAHHLPASRAAFAAAARDFWCAYCDALGPAPWPGFDDGYEARAVRHTLGCLLARVEGRSCLEYLSPTERARQGEAVVQLMAGPTMNIPRLVDRFVESLQCQRT